MTRARAGELALSVLLIAFAIGLPLYRWLEHRGEERARRVFEDEAGRAALAKVSDLPAARLISVRANREGSACGWIELSPGIGAVPFRAVAPVETGEDILVIVPRVDETDPVDWVLEIFSKQLTVQMCDRPYAPDEPLTTPANAHRDPRVDGPVLALWDDDGPEWAVIPAREAGYVALRRQVGGGATLSPLFSDRAAAAQWTRADGANLARRRDEQGAERMRRFDACLNLYEPGDPARRTCFNREEPAAPS